VLLKDKAIHEDLGVVEIIDLGPEYRTLWLSGLAALSVREVPGSNIVPESVYIEVFFVGFLSPSR
jgi:hypothetical protein